MPAARTLARSPWIATTLAVLLVLVGLGPARAATGDLPDPEAQVVGGCLIRYDSNGTPYIAATRVRPCIGVSGISVTSQGELQVDLTPEADAPSMRLLVTNDLNLAQRGIAAGATRGTKSIFIRQYDDRLKGRVDLRNASHRARVAGGAVSVGWLGLEGSRVTGAPLGIDAYGPYRDAMATNRTTVAGGCVVRFSTTGPWIHANSAHRCVGVRSVSVTNGGRLLLTLSDEQRGSTVNVSADPDETVTARGIIAGTSYTSSSTVAVQFYDTVNNRPLDLTTSSDRNRIAGSASNVWFSWTKTTDRPGAINATYTQAPNKYGPYVDGSANRGGVQQTGCEIRFSQTGTPRLYSSWPSRCRGVSKVTVDANGDLMVYQPDGADGAVIGTTTVSSRALTDYGIRAGLSGGTNRSRYRIHSIKLDRDLNLNSSTDRAILQRSGSQIYVGWSKIPSS